MEITQEQYDRLMAENKALQDRLAAKGAGGTISFKVSPKGAVSAYGLGRFPVTLYQSQWERLFGVKTQLEGFISANRDKLATKPIA